MYRTSICRTLKFKAQPPKAIFATLNQRFGGSSQLCASLLHTIFASLARTNQRVHVRDERNFPQAKLDSEINVRFLLNEHGDLYFLLHNNSVRIVLLNLKKN